MKQHHRSEWLAPGILLTALAIAASFFVPEVRRALGLEKKEPRSSSATVNQTAPNGIAINGGTVVNPTINNFPPANEPDRRPSLAMPPNSSDQITVQVGPDVDSKYAFETRFILTNHNPSKIADAGYLCTIQNFDASKSGLTLNQPVNMVLSASGPIEDLPSGDSRSLYCDFVGADFLVQSIQEPRVVIDVHFKYNNVETHRGFLFFTKRRPDGTYAWLPGGATTAVAPQAPKKTNPVAPTGTIAIAMNGIANAAPNEGTETVNNYREPQRHLSASQVAALKLLGESLTDEEKPRVRVLRYSGEETQNYGMEITDALNLPKGQSGTTMGGSVPVGLCVCVHDRSELVLPLAQKIAQTMRSSGISYVLAPAPNVGSGDVGIIVGAQ